MKSCTRPDPRDHAASLLAMRSLLGARAPSTGRPRGRGRQDQKAQAPPAPVVPATAAAGADAQVRARAGPGPRRRRCRSRRAPRKTRSPTSRAASTSATRRSSAPIPGSIRGCRARASRSSCRRSSSFRTRRAKASSSTCRRCGCSISRRRRRASRSSCTRIPIGIGRVGWATPQGTTKVVRRQKDPTWRPTASILKEHRENGEALRARRRPRPGQSARPLRVLSRLAELHDPRHEQARGRRPALEPRLHPPVSRRHRAAVQHGADRHEGARGERAVRVRLAGRPALPAGLRRARGRPARLEEGAEEARLEDRSARTSRKS